MENLIQQMSDESDAVVVANIACWRNKDKDGHYLTVELSPKYQKRNERPTPDEHSSSNNRHTVGTAT